MNGLVLAGGRSRRMGSDKARLEYNGQALAHLAHANLQAVCEATWYSIRADQEDDPLFEDAPHVIDPLEKGPMSGIQSAFQIDPGPWLVLACDMPHAGPECLQQLVDQRDVTCQATVYASEHGFEPLCALYEPSISPALDKAMAAQAYSLQELLSGCTVRKLEARDPQWFHNLNAPEDLH